MQTALGAAFGDDDYGEFCWRTLEEQEGIDLSRSRRYSSWHSPVTVSIAVGRDRRMVTHGHAAPENASAMIGTPPRARAVLLDLKADQPLGAGHAGREWADQARKDGALIFADVGWDHTGEWPTHVVDQLEHCHAFMPNAVEAMSYTRTDTAQDALFALADRVPLAVVTNGNDGALAIDGSTGEEAAAPALRVKAIDPTGAGDVFDAAITLGTLAGWPLAHRLNFASLCSALAVQEFGGLARGTRVGRHRRLVAPPPRQRRPQRGRGVHASSLHLPRVAGTRRAFQRGPSRRRHHCQAVGCLTHQRTQDTICGVRWWSSRRPISGGGLTDALEALELPDTVHGVQPQLHEAGLPTTHACFAEEPEAHLREVLTVLAELMGH